MNEFLKKHNLAKSTQEKVENRMVLWLSKIIPLGGRHREKASLSYAGYEYRGVHFITHTF